MAYVPDRLGSGPWPPASACRTRQRRKKKPGPKQQADASAEHVEPVPILELGGDELAHERARSWQAGTSADSHPAYQVGAWRGPACGPEDDKPSSPSAAAATRTDKGGATLHSVRLWPWDERRFRLVKVLMPAKRSGGEVALYIDNLTETPVAVKRVPASQLSDDDEVNLEQLENPWQEFGVAQYLQQFCIPGVSEHHGSFMTSNGDGMLATEYHPGGDLFELASKLGAPGPERELKVWPLMCSLLDAVRTIHAHGVAHCDLSLENLMFRWGRTPPQVVIVDFGMSVAGDLTAAIGIRGKSSYQAPEMHEGPTYDARYCDLFACGVVAYTLAFGGYPWLSTRPGKCRAWMCVQKYGLTAFLQRRRVTLDDGSRVSVEALMSNRYRLLLETLLDPDPPRRAAALDSDLLRPGIVDFEGMCWRVAEDAVAGM